MNIPKVGQKYVCACHNRSSHIEFGKMVEVVGVGIMDTVGLKKQSNGDLLGWDYVAYPNDFKLVQESDDVHHDAHDAIKHVYSCLSKPVVGLQSWQAHDSLRVQDILAAMQRYVAANKAVPNEWLEELIDKLDIEYEQ